MKYSEAAIGRIFVIKLEDDERLPDAVESFAEEKGITRGMCFLVGGIKEGGKIVVGPEDAASSPIIPAIHELIGVHEILGIGNIFPDEKGRPRLHMHAALGRGGQVKAGCTRPGIEVWKVGELLLLEFKNNQCYRKRDPVTGFEILEPGGEKQ